MTDEYDPVELLAKVLEYEHALEHVIQKDHHDPSACLGCQRLSQSALEGVNRDDFREIAQEILYVDANRPRWIDSIAESLASLDENFWTCGYAGDRYADAARIIWLDLNANGFDIYTYGEDVAIRPYLAFRSLLERFQRPRFVKPDVYERQFAERIVDEIRGAGLEIRPA